MTMLPVLMYHGLHPDARAPGRFDSVYSVCPKDFADQLDWLQAQGYRSARLHQTVSRADGHGAGKPVVISFDDGDISNVEVALPLLRERDMVAEFFITTDFIDQPGMLTSADIRTLAGCGMGIGSHGRSHRFLEDLPAEELENEFLSSRRVLSAISGREVDSVALPGGRGGSRELRTARTLGYRHLLGSVPGPNRHPHPDAWMQRIPITRQTTLAEFTDLVRWRGARPHLALARFRALAWCKHALGNTRYERLRARLL